jgi:hypothetical protein
MNHKSRRDSSGQTGDGARPRRSPSLPQSGSKAIFGHDFSRLSFDATSQRFGTSHPSRGGSRITLNQRSLSPLAEVEKAAQKNGSGFDLRNSIQTPWQGGKHQRAPYPSMSSSVSQYQEVRSSASYQYVTLPNIGHCMQSLRVR